MAYSNHRIDFFILFITLQCVSCFPHPGPLPSQKTNFSPSNINFSSRTLSLTKSKENFISDENSESEIPDQTKYDIYQSLPSTGKQYLEKETSHNTEKESLSRFYRQEKRSMNPSDIILFPSASTSSSFNNGYNRPFADRYNKHRPNIPLPNRPIPFNFAYGLPTPTPVEQNNRRTTENLFSPQQDQLIYQTLMQLFQRIAYPQTYSQTTVGRNRELSGQESIQDFNIVAVEDGVNYQSLYSGPRVQKSPCANGMHRTHGGLCHQKSRRLLNT